MDSPFQGSPNLPSFPFDEDGGRIQLTQEEYRILKECNQEGIQKRGIPLGISSGIISYFAAKQAKVLNHAKFGSIPFVIFSAFSGYFVGRLSYFSVCLQRLMNVPDGVVRQKMTREGLPGVVSPQVGQIPVTVDPKTYAQSRPTDIDTLSMSNFDTLPSNLDSDTPQLPMGPSSTETPQRYTSYDDLRERNRKEYMERMQQSSYSQTRPGYGYAQPAYPPAQPEHPPQQPPTQFGFTGEPIASPVSQTPVAQQNYQRRPRVPVQPGDPETMPTQDSAPIPRRVKTKYGDEWE